MKALWVVLGVVGLIVVVLLFAGGSYVSAKNQMVQKSADVDAAFSNIDVDLQRRSDLIPNLVASVKGYANVEETVLANIANARAGLMTAQTPNEKLAANDRLSVALLPKFPLWQLTGDQIWHTSHTVQAQQRLLAEIPAGADVLMPWSSDPYTLGHVHPINISYTEVAPEWMLTGDLKADVASLNLSLPAGHDHARYVSVATDRGWTIAKLVQP